MPNFNKILFTFAVTVFFVIALAMSYIMITNPDRIFGDATRTEVIQEMQDFQAETGPSPEEMTDIFTYNMNLFETETMKQLLAKDKLEVAFIPSRKTYVEFKVGENNDAQYIPGPEYDIIVVQGGHFEFAEPLLYSARIDDIGTQDLANQLSYRIDLVSNAMTTVQNLIQTEKVSDKILRYVVSDEALGIMHFETDCTDGGSCQFEINTKDGSITIMSP